ncbi:SIR2 family protein [Bosea psychrotolerans]|uniref:SIR2-like protein n=1 Tax=Bosea psychrotolerans TaxID=1871628 RepID=A0A2S4M5N3_9HYPH|nr:SIR2 family protein [Bosea psychrotolerans]POR50011.1 SIR2-like protein [Bosea psychrotolerans]
MIELPPFDALALSLHHSPGVHAILVGSGLSRAAGIPTGWEITLDLIRRLAALDGATEREGWATWYRDKYGKEPSYSEILDALASTQAERRAILHGYIEPAEGEEARKPTKAHHAIAQLVVSGAVRLVITTNFDRLIENALREAGIEPTVIAGDDAIAGATPLVHAKCTVIKVHGDYLDARIKNTDAELEGYSPAMNTLLDQVFDNFGLLSVGWSGEWDTALRSAILRAPSRRYPFYWAARGKAGGLAQDLLDQRGGRSFSITDADSFFVKLAETLEALNQASRPHPQSVEMAVALAKRYCRDDKFAMEWAEFLHAEVEKVRRYVTGPDYPNDGRPGEPLNDTMNAIVSDLMARTEIIRRAVLVCGRWGTTAANRAVVRAIQELSSAGDARSGTVQLLSLRDFGASICFYWNLAGLLDLGDWSMAKALLHAEIKGGHSVEPMFNALPFVSYEHVDWKFLKGLGDKIVPISEFLFDAFKREARDIALMMDRSDELFDATEFAAALEFANYRAHGGGSWFWMPAGRFIWKRRGQFLKDTFAEIERRDDSHPAFKAGLVGGSKAKATITLKAAGEFVEKHFSRYH